MRFVDLFDLEEIQRIQDAFALSLGVASIITTPDGTPITRPSNFSRLCVSVVRGTPTGLANCMKSDAVLGQPNPDGPSVHRCLSAGLWDGGAAICVGSVHIANWLIGQVRDDSQDDRQLLEYADAIGANRDEFASALSEVTWMSRTQFEQACNSLYLFANQLSKFAFQNLQLRESRAVLQEFNRQLEDRVQERTEELNRANQKLERAFHDLEEAFQRIRTLKGLLPICAHCKKIRDDRGYWNHLEQYLEDHTDASFSHGLCPDCAMELYGELGRSVVEGKKT